MPQTPDMPSSSATNPPPAGPRRRRRIWLWVLLIVVLLVVAPLGSLRGWVAYRAHVELERYRAAGHPTTLAEYEAKYPTPRPPARNGWEDVFEACKYIQEADEQQERLVPFLGDAPEPPSGQPWPDEVRQAAERYLAQNAQAMDLGRQALEADYFLRRFEPWRGFDAFPGTELRPYRKLLVLYRLEHGVHREQWSADRQVQAVRLGVRLANVTRDEPSLIGMLFAIVARAQVLTQCQWVIESGRPTATQLDDLDRLLADMHKSMPGVRALEGEGLCLLPMMEDPSTLLNKRKPLWRILWNWVGLSDVNRAAYLQVQRKILYAFSQADLRQMLQEAHAADEQTDGLGSIAIMTLACLPSGSAPARQTAGLATRIDAARVAVALERYRLDHRACPQTLADLVPSYLQRVPLDPFAADPDQTLRYLPSEDGYVVYSVGPDGQDDGGVASAAGGSQGWDLAFEVRSGAQNVIPATQAQDNP